uniref:F-box domain-containing protein n=1 Tax=Arundo donax TaxID=35708 RepID=A0A0A8YM41_ARUDO
MVRDRRNVSLDRSMLEIWKLNDYSSGGWSLKHRIDLLQHVARDLIGPQIIKVIGSVGNCESTKKIVIATSKRKVIVYDPVFEILETILAIRATYSSYQTEQSALRVSLFQESLVPVHQTNEEIALSAALAKVTREILLRLPGDYIVQSKLVCKQWLRLIENKRFMRSYYLHNNMGRRPKIMLVGKGTGGSGFSFVPFKKLFRHIPNHDTWLDTKVVCSNPCVGMNLLSTELKDYLYNPCTGF